MASHLGPSDVLALTGTAPLTRTQVRSLGDPEVLTPASAPDLPGALRVTARRGHLPLSAPVDTARGALDVRLYRDIPDTSAWGEPGTRGAEVRGPVRVGETLRMVVRSTRPIECGELEAVVPLCGAFDTRPPVGAGGSEARQCWTLDRRLRGRVESQAWRPSGEWRVVWEATLRVTHAGRFTLLPPVLRGRYFPELYRTSPRPLIVEAEP